MLTSQYFLGNGNCHEKHLWANNLDNHILAMKMIYESFDEQDKPVWINNEMIDLYKDQMWADFSFKTGEQSMRQINGMF